MVDFNINTDDMGSAYSQMQNMSLTQRNSTAVNSHVDATIEEIDHTPSAYEEHQRQQAAARAARVEIVEEVSENDHDDEYHEALGDASTESVDDVDDDATPDIEVDTENDIETDTVSDAETDVVNDTEDVTVSGVDSETDIDGEVETVNETEVTHDAAVSVEQSTDHEHVKVSPHVSTSETQNVDDGFTRVCTQLPRHSNEAEDAYFLRLYTHVWNEREQLKDSYQRLPSGSPYGEAMFTDIKTTADVLIQIIRAGEKATPRDEFNDPTYDFRAKAQSTHEKPAVKKPVEKSVQKPVAATEPPAEKKSPEPVKTEPVKTQTPKSEPAGTEPDRQSAPAETTKPSAKEKPPEPTPPVASESESTPAAQQHVVSKAETGNAVYVPLADVVSATRAAEYIHYPLEERNMPGEGVDGKLGNTDLTINGLSLNKYIDEGKDVKRNTVQLPSSVMAAVSEHLEKCGYGTGATNNQIVMGALLSILPETHPLISKTQYDENTDLIRRVFGRINLSLDRNTNEIIEMREGLVDMMSFVLQLSRILDAQSVTTATVGELTSWLVAEKFDTKVRNQALEGSGVSALNTRDEHVAEYYNKVAQQIMKDRTRAEEERKKKQQEAREQRDHEIQESLKKRADGQVRA